MDVVAHPDNVRRVSGCRTAASGSGSIERGDDRGDRRIGVGADRIVRAIRAAVPAASLERIVHLLKEHRPIVCDPVHPQPLQQPPQVADDAVAYGIGQFAVVIGARYPRRETIEKGGDIGARLEPAATVRGDGMGRRRAERIVHAHLLARAWDGGKREGDTLIPLYGRDEGRRMAMRKAPIGAGAAALALAATMAQAAPADGQMMVRIAELSIDPTQIDAYKAILKTEQEASVRDEPGVLMLHSVQIADDPTQIRLLEVYADRAAYGSHIRSPHFLTYKTATERMVRSLRLVETRPILLCAKSKGRRGGPVTCL